MHVVVARNTILRITGRNLVIKLLVAVPILTVTLFANLVIDVFRTIARVRRVALACLPGLVKTNVVLITVNK